MRTTGIHPNMLLNTSTNKFCECLGCYHYFKLTMTVFILLYPIIKRCKYFIIPVKFVQFTAKIWEFFHTKKKIIQKL